MRDQILLQDNARNYAVALTQQELEQLSWKTLEHPALSPDLLPYVFLSLVHSKKLASSKVQRKY